MLRPRNQGATQSHPADLYLHNRDTEQSKQYARPQVEPDRNGHPLQPDGKDRFEVRQNLQETKYNSC